MHRPLTETETCYVVDSVVDSTGYNLGKDLRQPTWKYIRTSVRGNLRDWTGERIRNLVIDDIWSSIEDAALDYFKNEK